MSPSAVLLGNFKRKEYIMTYLRQIISLFLLSLIAQSSWASNGQLVCFGEGIQWEDAYIDLDTPSGYSGVAYISIDFGNGGNWRPQINKISSPIGISAQYVKTLYGSSSQPVAILQRGNFVDDGGIEYQWKLTAFVWEETYQGLCRVSNRYPR